LGENRENQKRGTINNCEKQHKQEEMPEKTQISKSAPRNRGAVLEQGRTSDRREKSRRRRGRGAITGKRKGEEKLTIREKQLQGGRGRRKRERQRKRKSVGAGSKAVILQ